MCSLAPTGSKWMKAKELQKGDKCKIVDEAIWVEGEYQGQKTNQYCVNVEYNGEQRKLKLTVASCNEVAPVYGKDSIAWINKELSLEPVKVLVGGEVKHSILAIPIGISAEPQLEAQGDSKVPWDEENET